MTRPVKNIKVLGNTFLATGTTASREPARPFINLYAWTGGGGLVNEGIVIKNNIFTALSSHQGYPIAIHGDDGISTNLSSDHNLFYFPGSSWSLAQWRADSGMDGGSVEADPNFSGPIPIKTYSPGEPLSLEENYLSALDYVGALHLSASSPRGIGELLELDSYFDYDGKSRYTGDNQVDAGAFEYSPQ